MTYKKDQIWEDKWINTTCGVCYCGCGIKVRVVNGVPVKIEGINESTMGGPVQDCAEKALPDSCTTTTPTG